MFNKYIKIFFAVGALAYSIYEFSESYIGAGIMWILLASIFIFLFFFLFLLKIDLYSFLNIF